MAHEIAAGVVEISGERSGDFGGAIAQTSFSMLRSALGQVLNLCLRFFLVPFGGLQKIVDSLMLGGFGPALEIGQALGRDRVGGFAQELFHAA